MTDKVDTNSNNTEDNSAKLCKPPKESSHQAAELDAFVTMSKYLTD